MKRLLPSLVVIVVAITGCTSAVIAPLPSPPKVKQVPVATTLADYSDVSIPSVQGTTTTVIPSGFRGGKATIKGRVTLGGAPAQGALVRIERFSGDSVAGTVDVTAGDDGSYSMDGLVGGRFRVRAFRAPDAAMPSAQTFFLGATDVHTLDLSLQAYSGGLTVNASVSPSPPILGEFGTLTVGVFSRGVDASGVARSIGQAGVQVQIISAGGKAIVSINPTVTGANGRAQFMFRCDALDRQGISAIVAGAATAALSVKGCELPPTTTTEEVETTLPATTTTAPKTTTTRRR